MNTVASFAVWSSLSNRGETMAKSKLTTFPEARVCVSRRNGNVRVDH